MKIQGKVKVRRVSLLTHTGLRFSSVFLFIIHVRNFSINIFDQNPTF